MPSILIINPNSSQSVTQGLKDILDPPHDFTFKFFTCPSNGPDSINDYTTGTLSAAACLPALLPVLDQHDGFLVACFSEHALVNILREHTDRPVMGIFQAAILHSLSLNMSVGLPDTGKFAIVTTGSQWEPVLDRAVAQYVPANSFVGTFGTGLGVLELHEADTALVNDRIAQATLAALDKGATVICLGCAGMAGMEDVISSVAPHVKVVDGVVAGCEILVGLVRTYYS